MLEFSLFLLEFSLLLLEFSLLLLLLTVSINGERSRESGKVIFDVIFILSHVFGLNSKRFKCKTRIGGAVEILVILSASISFPSSVLTFNFSTKLNDLRDC